MKVWSLFKGKYQWEQVDYVILKNTLWGFLPEFVSEAWIDQVQRLTIRLELIKRPFRNRLWRSSTHRLINGFSHPLWRQFKHHNRVIRRGFYPVRVVQQENDRQHRFSIRGSHQYYMFKYWFGIRKNFIRVISEIKWCDPRNEDRVDDRFLVGRHGLDRNPVKRLD